MISLTRFIAIASLSAPAFLAGCSASQATSEQAITAASMRSSTDIATSLSPIDSVNEISQVFSRLRFDVHDQSLDGLGLHAGGPNDYFFATVFASGANDMRAMAIAQWKGEGNTAIHFTSDLDGPKHQYVVSLLRNALATTTPTSTAQPK